MIKRCARCGEEFDRATQAKYCLNCVKESRRERSLAYYHAHREERRKYRRNWRIVNYDRISTYRREYYVKSKRYLKLKFAVLRGDTHENYRTVGNVD